MQRSRLPANVHGERFAVSEDPDQDVLVRWSRRSQPAADVDSSKKGNGVSVWCLKEGKLKGVTRLRPAHVRISRLKLRKNPQTQCVRREIVHDN
jgi:hypothetical protein